MQLFARLPAGLLRRLRTVLRLAIPTAVAADTARSVVVTYQLAQQRFQVGAGVGAGFTAILMHFRYTPPVYCVCVAVP